MGKKCGESVCVRGGGSWEGGAGGRGWGGGGGGGRERESLKQVKPSCFSIGRS